MPKRDRSHSPTIRIPVEARKELDKIRAIEGRPRSYGALIADLVARRLRELELGTPKPPHFPAAGRPQATPLGARRSALDTPPAFK